MVSIVPSFDAGSSSSVPNSDTQRTRVNGEHTSASTSGAANSSNTTTSSSISTSTASSSSSPSLAVVVDGDALLKILRRPLAKLHFEMFAKQCATVIACRVSPIQKAEMVNLVQDSIFPPPITLAIGDGANDVDMIQAACVGIGISGKEGLQAVNASDFSIAQFRFLSRLLLVHGRWNYRRMSMVLLYSFYKNITVAMGTFVYSIFTGWSGQTPFESWLYSSTNWFLLLPIIILGLLERDLSDGSVLADPRVYETGRKNMDIGMFKMFLWIINAVISVFIGFILPWLAFTGRDFGSIGGTAPTDDAGVWIFGSTVYVGLVNAMHLRCALETMTWTWLQVGAFAISIIYFFGFMVIYTTMDWFSPTYYWVSYKLFALPSFWLCAFILIPATNCLFDATVRYVRLQCCCTSVDTVIERERLKWSIPP
jgi:magnesium-transporting ATPase (P-type)